MSLAKHNTLIFLKKSTERILKEQKVFLPPTILYCTTMEQLFSRDKLWWNTSFWIGKCPHAFRKAFPEDSRTTISNFWPRAITSNIIQITGHKRRKGRKLSLEIVFNYCNSSLPLLLDSNIQYQEHYITERSPVCLSYKLKQAFFFWLYWRNQPIFLNRNRDGSIMYMTRNLRFYLYRWMFIYTLA